MALPLVSHVYAKEMKKVDQDIGTVFAFDTAGGVVGALTAGLFLVPSIGLRHTIEVAFLINLAIVLVIVLFPFHERGFFRKAFIGMLLLLVTFYFAFLPEWDQHMMNAGVGRFTRRELLSFRDYMEDSRKGKILFFKEGKNARVSVEQKLGVKTLLINSKPEASTMGDTYPDHDRTSAANSGKELSGCAGSGYHIGDLPTLLSRQFVFREYLYRIVGDGIVNRELHPVLEYNAPLVLFKRKRVSIVQIDERFSRELADLYINRYRSIYPLTAANYHNMSAYEFKNPFASDLRLAYSLMEKCTSMAPENEKYLYNFAILLQKMGKLDYAREITARLLRIDKKNRNYQEMFVEITLAIENEKRSVFYLPVKNKT